MSGTSIVAVAIGLICLLLAVLVLLALPTQLRDNRLKQRGVETDAVCVERIRTSGVLVHFVRCHYRVESGAKFSTRINAPVPAPELGQSFRIVYDPQRPSDAASVQYMASAKARTAYSFLAALVVLATVAVLLVTVFS
ncbi:DUF3592 domain-containing protein [Streptomyces sp. Act-28]